MSRYKLHYTGKIILRDDGMQIPVAENWAYQEFLEWDAIPGNDPDPADPAPLPDPQETSDNLLLGELRTVYQGLKDGLAVIQATHDALAADATTLSTITLTGLTIAQLETQLQGTLRKVGTDLGTMIDNTDKLARGSERLLNTLAALIRQVRPGSA